MEDKNEKEQDKKLQVSDSKEEKIKQRVLQKKKRDALASAWLVANCLSIDCLNKSFLIPGSLAAISIHSLFAFFMSALPIPVPNLSTSKSVLLVFRSFVSVLVPGLSIFSAFAMLIPMPRFSGTLLVPGLSFFIFALLMLMPDFSAFFVAFAVPVLGLSNSFFAFFMLMPNFSAFFLLVIFWSFLYIPILEKQILIK